MPETITFCQETNMAAQGEIRPIYEELLGCLLEAPNGSNGPVITDSRVWELYHATIDELNRITGNDYGKYRVNGRSGHDERGFWQQVSISEYKSKISSLIGRLHAQFFPTEPSHLSSSPAMIVNQVQQQSQTVYIQIAVELAEQLTRKEQDFKEGSKERRFIDRAKGYLKSATTGVTNTAHLITALLRMARECGLSIDDVQGVFGG